MSLHDLQKPKKKLPFSWEEWFRRGREDGIYDIRGTQFEANTNELQMNRVEQQRIVTMVSDAEITSFSSPLDDMRNVLVEMHVHRVRRLTDYPGPINTTVTRVPEMQAYRLESTVPAHMRRMRLDATLY